jgi:hypothetical protein
MPDILHSLTIDEASRLIIIRLMSRQQAIRVLEGLNERFAALDAPWEYDAIYDLRRHSAIVDTAEMKAHAEKSQKLIMGRDAGRATLFVTRDPILRARKGIYQEHSPRRIVEMFDTLDEALEWHSRSREKAA